MNNYICFDLEGSLISSDNAHELMSIIPNGHLIFEVIRRYDELLTMEGRSGYEPGDALTKILPFLLINQIGEEDIIRLAMNAKLIDGAPELIEELHRNEWNVFCITATFNQYAHRITKKLGIKNENVVCTNLPPEVLQHNIHKSDLYAIEALEKAILKLAEEEDDVSIKRVLDNYYWKNTFNTDLGRSLKLVQPVGGKRKVAALKKFSLRHDNSFADWLVIGDSITDFKILRSVNDAKGLSVAFNASRYALPYATVALASIRISDIFPLALLWCEKGRTGVKDMVKGYVDIEGNGPHFHWLDSIREIDEVAEEHKKTRQLIRGGSNNLT